MIDAEKIPDAPRATIAYAGVEVSSRYGKRHELEAMMAAIDYLIDRAPGVARLMVGLFCDSKACACYVARCCRPNGPCTRAEARELGQYMDAAFRAIGGGHNGIQVDTAEGASSIWIEPWWPE